MLGKDWRAFGRLGPTFSGLQALLEVAAVVTFLFVNSRDSSTMAVVAWFICLSCKDISGISVQIITPLLFFSWLVDQLAVEWASMRSRGCSLRTHLRGPLPRLADAWGELCWGSPWLLSIMPHFCYFPTFELLLSASQSCFLESDSRAVCLVENLLWRSSTCTLRSPLSLCTF